MTVQDDDQLLVCRNSTPYNLKSQNVMAELLDDDLMLVCRNGTPYKATGLDIKESIGPQEAPPYLTSVVLTEDSPGGDRFDNQSFTSTLNWATKGVPEASVEMKATVTGTLDIAGTTDEIVGIEGSTPSFAPVLYTGNAGVQSITGVGFKPDLVWTKSRDTTYSHRLYDSLRGTNNWLCSNLTDAATPESGTLTSFDADGFTLGEYDNGNYTNGGTAVAWNFRAAPKFFDIQTYSGDDVAGRTVSHNLNSIPGMMIVKKTSGSGSWDVYHKSLGATQFIELESSFGAGVNSTVWNDTEPTSTEFTVGTSINVNNLSQNYVAYLFADEPGLIKCGSYTGAAGSVSVDTGFEPQWVLVKNTTVGGTSDSDWQVLNKPMDLNGLRPNTSDSESGLDGIWTWDSTGFTTNIWPPTNDGSSTYIYVAIAESASGSPNTTLTLASDVNLANGVFKAGDAVKQNNSPIVPTSSAITNVVSAPIIYSSGVVYTGDPSGSPSDSFNGNTGDNFVLSSNGSYEVTFNPPLIGAFRVWISTGSSVAPNYDYEFNDDGVVRTGSGNNGFVTLPSTPGIVSKLALSNTQGLGYFINAFDLDGVILVDGTESATTLTLTDASGLSDFEVEDVVQSDWNQSEEWSNGTVEGAANGPWSDVFDGDLTTGAFTYDSNTSTITLPRPTAWTNKFEVYALKYGGTLFVNGIDVGGSIPGFDTTSRWHDITSIVGASGNLSSIGISDVGTNYVKLFAVRLDGKLLVDASIPDPNAVSITAIDEAAPSITTDGGLWSGSDGTGDPDGETFVTGPTTDITATFVSADPTVPSMTVSDVVGPWSANTGNFVENTVVNPIMIKPETSAITNVGTGPAYSSGVFLTGQSWTGDGSSQRLFDGVVAAGNSFTGSDSPVSDSNCIKVIFAIPFTNVTSVRIYGAFNGAFDSKAWYNNEFSSAIGTDTLKDPVEWKTVYSGTGITLNSVSFGIQDNLAGEAANVGAIEVNGVVLTDSGPILTLQNDTDLAQFSAGDAVYAAGDAAPVSFAPVIYTGNAGTQEISCGFAPDLVWIKDRIDSYGNQLFDTVRGATNGLVSNTTAAQFTYPGVTDFGADGFTIGTDTNVNNNNDEYVAWCWDAGDTTVTNNDGATEATVRSNGDFSVVKAALGSATTLGHGLNSIPAMVVSKSSSKSSGWFIHLPGEMNVGQSLSFNTAGVIAANIWSGVMTDKVINFNANNQVGGTEDWIFYCWAESPTQSFGSYTGNGLADGPVIDCGFKPALVMVKRTTDGGGDWIVVDTGRDNGKELYWNSSSEESGASYRITITDTGFQLTDGATNPNSDGETYIYAAFAGGGGPTGVVGDITGLDMTLSESTGTWEVGQKVTMDEKPAISTTANLIFDSTGAVTGLSTQPVAGQLMSDKDTPKLTFGDGAGTGETWDEELPAGTHLQTSFVATNVEGTSSATSNEITP
jgi:hypothetical protein